MIDGLAHIRKVITRFDADLDESQGLDDLCKLMFETDLLLNDIKAFRSRVEQIVAKEMPNKVHEFPGGTAEYKGGSKRTKWDHPLLAGRVVTEAMEQGEHPQEALLACAGIGYWRTGELRKRGIDPDQYAEVEHGLPHVVIRAKEGD